ncbi:hypothetical protein BDEG_22299 [Batrachochytrium dendrobatidis JEL423]|uniref:Uncharacterized protein n=1 Tax=Batrachochytrium dendrobatidis (strain JEL423) TaxID=403673 RepID=A0A177WF20_BATDL|nr:hypothetical protein BDEG_22299 [Batrachochytrium dendrobatidis JEL423]
MQELTYNTDGGVKVIFEEMAKLRKALERMNVVTSNSEFFRKILWKLIDVSRHWVSMRKEFNDYSEKDLSTQPIKDMLIREEEDLIRAHELPKLQNAKVALHSSFEQRKPSRANYNQPHLRGFTNGDHSNDSRQNVQNSNNSSYWPNGKKKILRRNCGKLGSHLAKDCRARSSNNSQSNSNYASTSCYNSNANNDFSFHNTTTSPKTDYCSISRNIVSEIILDSGATTHMKTPPNHEVIGMDGNDAVTRRQPCAGGCSSRACRRAAQQHLN